MITMEGNYLSPIIDAFKPILIFAAVLWGSEIIITMLIKDHKKAKRKQAREKRRLEYQDRRIANDAEHAKVTRAMRYDVLRRDNFHCVPVAGERRTVSNCTSIILSLSRVVANR